MSNTTEEQSTDTKSLLRFRQDALAAMRLTLACVAGCRDANQDASDDGARERYIAFDVCYGVLQDLIHEQENMVQEATI